MSGAAPAARILKAAPPQDLPLPHEVGERVRVRGKRPS